jgi:predicted GIY-YIG superfamily endonuclease
MSTAKQLSQLEQIKNRIQKIQLENDNTKTNIYILKLQNNKYYIGKTDNVEKRFLEHVNSKGSIWTQLYKPISVEKIIPNSSPFDEDKYVKEYMNKYGIENVRGGSYVTEILDEVSIFSLRKEIWAANDCCTQCGRKGHFVKDCKDIKQEQPQYQRKNRNKVFINTNDDDIEVDEYDDDDESVEYIEVYQCSYCDKEFDTEKGAKFHENIYCKNKTKSYGGGGIKSNTCSRCGRVGHNVTKCYARTDADGDDLDDSDDSDDSYDSDDS